MARKKTASDHQGFGPLMESSAPIAPRLAPTIAIARPYVLPASSEKPPVSWISPRTITTQPQRVEVREHVPLAAGEDVGAVERADAVDDGVEELAISSSVAANAARPAPAISYLLECSLCARGR